MIRRTCTTLLLLCALALPARAQPPWAPHTGSRVESVRVEGLRDFDVDALRKGLALHPRSKMFGKERQVLRAAAAEADLARVRLYLARRGYPRAEVTMRVERLSERERVRVVFAVTPGVRVSVGDLFVEGAPENLQAKLHAKLAPLRTGAPFVDAELRRASQRLVDAMTAEGYARTRVDIEVGEARDDRVEVRFRVRPGARFHFGRLEVEGVSEDLRDLARDELWVPRGEPYHPRVLREAREDLRVLDLFRQIDVSTTPVDSTTLDVTARLAARTMRTLEFSVGTWSDYPVQVDALWRHRNLLGRGRAAAVEGSYATRRQSAATSFEWPSLLARRSTSRWSAEFEIEDEDAYLYRSGAVRWSNLFRLTRKTSLRAGVALVATTLDVRSEEVDLFDVEAGQQLVFEGQWFYDGVDDPLDPRRGWRLLLESAWAPVVSITEAPFLSLRAAVSRVQPIGGDATLAARIDLAQADPLGVAKDLLPSQRWFAGGFNTMRGAGRRDLGPADDGGDPVGGELRLLSGAELRVPLTGVFGISAFVDTGQVWSDPAEFDFDDLAVATGGGLLVYTPIGPVRLELARNVARLPIGGNHYQVQFGIGHPY